LAASSRDEQVAPLQDAICQVHANTTRHRLDPLDRYDKPNPAPIAFQRRPQHLGDLLFLAVGELGSLVRW